MVIKVEDENIRIERLELGQWQTNAYIIVCTRTMESAVIDAPDRADVITDSLKGTIPQYILLTHNHRDHVGALAKLRAGLGVPLGANALDAGNLSSPPERLLNDGDILPLGRLKIEVRHVPGHTPGSLCFRVGRYLFSGDTVFPGGPGHTGSPEAFRQIVKSIRERILVLPEDTQVYPGHGEATELKREKEEIALFSSRQHDPGLCGDVVWLTS